MDILNPCDYSHIISVHFMNKEIICGLTNKPNEMLIEDVHKLFNTSNMNVLESNSKINDKYIHFRHKDVLDNYEIPNTPIKFKDNKAIIELVIEKVINQKSYYIPEIKCVKEFDYNYILPQNSTFQIFIMIDKSLVCMVTNDMRIGDIADYIYKKTSVPIIQQRLIYESKQLDFAKTVKDYGIRYMSTLHSVLRLKGGMFHITSGKDDYDLINVCYYNLDS